MILSKGKNKTESSSRSFSLQKMRGPFVRFQSQKIAMKLRKMSPASRAAAKQKMPAREKTGIFMELLEL